MELKSIRRILVAPDKFKGTLTSQEAADIISRELGLLLPDAEITIRCMADGGEGTAAIIAKALGLERHTAAGHDALMRPAEIEYFTKGSVAVVDSAAVVGLAMLHGATYDPWLTSSEALGEFLMTMLQSGIEHIYVGVGGTACSDAGIGMLKALGMVYDEAAEVVDFSQCQFDKLSTRITMLSDVDVPLLPDMDGAMSVLSFAPQKGFSSADLPILEARILKFYHAVERALPSPGERHFEGAGGGIGYALARVVSAKAALGADILANIQGITSESADLVVTGEGHFDRQSLHGKVAGTLISRCAPTPVVVVCGKAEADVATEAHVVETLPFVQGELTHAEAERSLAEAMRHWIRTCS